MTVWVTEVQPVGRSKMCRMQSTSSGELHNMAARIGVGVQNPRGSRYDHYNVDASKRYEAIRRGAVEVTTEELARIIAALEEIGDLL